MTEKESLLEVEEKPVTVKKKPTKVKQEESVHECKLDWNLVGKEIEDALGLSDGKLDLPGINWVHVARIVVQIVRPAIQAYLRSK